MWISTSADVGTGGGPVAHNTVGHLVEQPEKFKSQSVQKGYQDVGHLAYGQDRVFLNRSRAKNEQSQPTVGLVVGQHTQLCPS